MLYTQTVAPRTLELLKKLESEPSLAAFNLAGGTALALYLGHRKSVDLDLLSPQSFDAKKLEAFLADKYGFRTDFMETDTLKGTIDGVKVDCIAIVTTIFVLPMKNPVSGCTIWKILSP